MHHLLILCLSTFAMLVMDAFAAGGLIATGNASSTPAGLSHGWIALPDPVTANLQGTMLAHVPPRKGAVAGAAFAVGSDDGVLLPVMRLESMPVGMAAWNDSLYLFFGPKRVAGGIGFEVLSLRALPTPLAELFAYEPRARLRGHPSVTMTGGFAGSIGSRFGPVVLMHEPGPVGMPVLLLLDGDRWSTIDAPPVLGDAGLDVREPLTLIADERGVGVVGRDRSGRLGLWRGAPRESALPGGAWAWEHGVLPALPDLALGARFVGVGKNVYAVGVREGTLHVWAIVGERWSQIGERAEVSGDIGLAWLAGQDRLVAVWQEDAPGPRAGTEDPVRPKRAVVWEVSGATGLVMHDGPAARSGPLSTGDFRALVVLLVGVTAAVLLFVVRVGDEESVPTLPEGAALASIGRRALAGAIDLMLAASVVSVVSGASYASLIDVLRLTPQGYGVMGLVQITFVGFGMSTLGEAISGRTIGKVLAGCVVLPVVGQDAIDRSGIGLGRAAMRNAVKWGLPPAAVLGVFETGGRHRGDMVGRTIVAERGAPSEPTEG